MELRRFGSVEAFLDVAEGFLVAREAEHNLILGICNTLCTVPGLYKEPPYLAVILDGGRVVGVSVQTPPWDIALSEMDAPTSVDLVVEDRIGEPPPGVIGPVALAARFAEAWSRRTGSPTRRVMQERAFRLRAVTMPRPSMGSIRPAVPADRDLVREWLGEFIDEALGESHDDLTEMADRWVSSPQRTMQLWIDDGTPVSMTGVGARTPNGVRIGPVYTPPALRGRGYASNLVAQASQWALDSGRTFVFLFTDLANSTSNHIYRAIGYEPVTDVDRWTFG